MVKCPNCGGEIWDNTAENDKRDLNGEKLRPEYACKDKDGCGWVMWREKGKKKILVETSKPVPKPPVKKEENPFVEGKEKNATLMCRTTLMCEIVKSLGNLGGFKTEEAIEIFNQLWCVIEQ